MFFDVDVGEFAPDIITYNTLVDCLFRSGRRPEAANLVRHIDDGYSADPIAHLAYRLARSGNVREALSLFDDMLAKGVALDAKVFTSVIKAFCKKRSSGVHRYDIAVLCAG